MSAIDKLINDSTLLMTMKEDEDEFTGIDIEKLNSFFEDKRNGIILRIYPIYQGVYPTNIEELFQSIEDLHYLQCEKEKELLLLLHYDEGRELVLSKLPENSLKEYNNMKISDDLKNSIIALDFLDLLIWKNYELNRNLFYQSSMHDSLEISKHIFNIISILENQGDIINQNLFIDICSNGCFKIVKWMYNQINSKIVINNSIFIYVCINGHVELAKWLYETNLKYDDKKINVEYKIFTALIRKAGITRKDGHIDLIKWLWNIQHQKGMIIDIHEDDENYLHWACASGHIKTVEYVLELGVMSGTKIDIYSRYFGAFQTSLVNGHFELFKYLFNYSIQDGSNEILVNYLIDTKYHMVAKACCGKNSDLLKYIISIVGQLDDNTRMFQYAVSYLIYHNNPLNSLKFAINMQEHLGNKIDLSKIDTSLLSNKEIKKYIASVSNLSKKK